MKRKLSLAFLLVAVTHVLSAQMLVGSYNIRYKNDGDSLKGELWSKRCQVICDQVNFMSPDIFGAQEVLHVQLVDLLAGLDGYGYIGVGRDDGKQGGEYEAVFYKKDRLRLIDHGDFWISENPDRPGLGWDAACIRICSWGKFAGMTATDDEAFYFFNLHMDHVGVVARREGAKLIVRKIREIAQGAPVIVTGDFNVDQTNEIYGIFTASGLLMDSYEAARVRFAENGTFNGFDINNFTSSRIDHVFVSPDVRVDAYGLLTNSYWMPDGTSEISHKASDAPQEISFNTYSRHLPSDHYPVFVRVKLR